MAKLEKGYLIAEIKNIFEKVELELIDYTQKQGITLESMDDPHTDAAKIAYGPLVQLFQLHFEPTFNEVKPEVDENYYKDLEETLEKYKLQFKEYESQFDIMENNQKILLEANNKLKDSYDTVVDASKEQINWLRSMFEKALSNGN